LEFTDLTLPGNAGFDLVLKRTYNSKIFLDQTFSTLDWDSWAGVGWSFHLGRVPVDMRPSETPRAVEMPDGSSHKLFANFVGNSGEYVTRDYWVYDPTVANPTLALPNGLVYTFAKLVDFPSGRQYRYPTLIRDPFGNQIEIQYASSGTAPDAFSTIIQHVGTKTRQITFSLATTGSGTNLRTMSYGSKTWTYTYRTSNNGAGYNLLTKVEPPVGPPWQFGYTTSGSPQSELVSMIAPWGGTITYGYATQGEFYLGSTVPIETRVVASRTLGGTSISPGTYTYAYAQGAQHNQSVVTAPSSCSGASTTYTTTYTFLGVGNQSPDAVWKIGLLSGRQAKQGSTTLETEVLTWRPPTSNDYVSPDAETVGSNTDYGIYAPVFAARTVTRGSRSYTTTNTYSSIPYTANGGNFNDYGRPWKVVETGDAGTRTTARTFRYGFAPYIVDRLDSEVVSIDSAPAATFSKSYAYNLANGFMTSETVYGIQTTYAPDAYGNVASRTNANGHTTSYGYDWGVLKTVTPPVSGTATTRVVNAEGTIASETRRGFTTSFQYDGLFRQTRRAPPAGNDTVTAYDNSAGAWIQVTRGPSSTTTTLDGFGRAIATNDSVGVQTATSYDACGRKTYESYPFKPSTYPKIGTTYAYDGLDRVTRKTNPDSSFAAYAYSTTNGIDVTITDENGHATAQDWSAFGDPREARLVGVTDARGKAFAYSYNAVGSLTGVTAPSGGVVANRSWVYYPGKNQLHTETHPETGTVTYTYWPAGNLKTKVDAAFGTTTYSYDGNERLTGIDRPGTSYDTTIGYDGSDNRTSLVNGYVRSTFGFDGANRLTSRQDVVNGQTLATLYTPDGNDNIQRIDYPSGNVVVYTYDSEDRIASVSNGGSTVYATTFSYHPSGGPLSFKPGGSGNPNPTQSFTYDNRYRLATLATGQRSLAYGYDDVGNVTSITESTRSGKNRSPIAYDELDRLTSVTGFTGGSYGYDNFGNRTSSTVAGTPPAYSYQSSTARLTSFTGSGALGYDGNGNLTSDGSRPYGYTPENLLEVVGQPTNPAATYRYDGDDLRTMKIDGVSGSTRYYVHGPGGQILSEFEEACAGTLQLVRDYVYAGARLLADVKPAVAPVQVGFELAASSPNETAGTLNLDVRVTTADGQPTHCPVTVGFTTADGTAVAGTDYTRTMGTLTFGPASPSGTAQTIHVPIIDNTLCQAGRSFSVQLSYATGASISQGVHAVTIVEDDLVCVSGTKAVSGAYTPGGAVTYTVTLVNSGSRAQPDNVGHEFTDTLSPLLTLDSVTASAGAGSMSANTALWDGSVPAQGAVTITIDAHVTADSAQVVSNQGTINYDLHLSGSNAQTASTNTVSFMVGGVATSFYTVPPCRVVDTRNPNSPVGGPALDCGTARVFPIAGYCSIPTTAQAISLNVTVVSPTADGNVALYPAGITPPGFGTIEYVTGLTIANNAVLSLNDGGLEAVCGPGAGTTHLVIDVNGYFQ
jgi:uncharacterized repeat protein (TIGR01451 family)